MGWRVNFWARLRDGNRALKLLKRQLQLVDSPEYHAGKGGTYLNMMDSHPPFQIDGNFGATAGITEMLIQSHNGYIEFLPALPDDWSEGELKGIKARGAFVIDLQWSGNEWTRAEILSEKGVKCSIRSESGIRIKSGKKSVRFMKSGNNLYTFSTEPGARYLVIPR